MAVRPPAPIVFGRDPRMLRIPLACPQTLPRSENVAARNYIAEASVENLALGQQLAVPERVAKRPRLRNGDHRKRGYLLVKCRWPRVCRPVASVAMMVIVCSL